MVAYEPVQAGPYPEPGDPPDGPNQMAAIVQWAVSRVVARFASEAARDLAITTPTEGQLAVTGSGATQVLWIRHGSDWVEVWRDTSWVDFTPTLTNVTLGNGTLSARYTQSGKTVSFVERLVAGSTTAITGTVKLGLPVTAASSTLAAGTGLRTAPNDGVIWRAADTGSLFVYAEGGGAWDNTISFASGAILQVTGTYQAA